MKKATRAVAPKGVRDQDLLPEYDFSGGVRGKYADHFEKGSLLVLLAPDVAEVFPDAASVNEALRSLIAIASRRKAVPRRRKRSQPAQGRGARAPRSRNPG